MVIEHMYCQEIFIICLMWWLCRSKSMSSIYCDTHAYRKSAKQMGRIDFVATVN